MSRRHHHYDYSRKSGSGEGLRRDIIRRRIQIILMFLIGGGLVALFIWLGAMR